MNGDGDAQRLGNLFAGCAMLQRGIDMGCDAPVTAHSDSDGQRDKFPHLGPKHVGLPASIAECHITLECVGTELANPFTPSPS